MTLTTKPVVLEMPGKFRALKKKSRYKVFYGGRGGGKSYAIARQLLVIAASKKVRVFCARELQSSISDSVHKLLIDQINLLGLHKAFTITKTSIVAYNGSEFIFKGLRHNAQEIKSLEGIDIAWIEEAQSVSRESWDTLIPTVRKEGSEIWVTFNPFSPDDETYRRFILNTPENCILEKITYTDNPWFPKVLRDEMEYCKRIDLELHAHIWLGEPRTISDAQIFKDKFEVTSFETPDDVRFFHGLDFGFAKDPTVLIRCFIQKDCLFVDKEAYGIGVELDQMHTLFSAIETATKWPIKADSSRPETISYLYRQGFRVKAAKKWQGSVEDGIAYLKSFRKIIIHPRCRHTVDEFRLYSYKVDKTNGDILPLVVDAHNHVIDGLRYSLDGWISKRRAMKMDPGVLMRARG